jgi:hypothetical protein
VDYSLFMAVMMVLTLERVEKRPGATPAAFPLQSSLEQPLFLCFLFLRHLRIAIVEGVFI